MNELKIEIPLLLLFLIERRGYYEEQKRFAAAGLGALGTIDTSGTF